MTRAARGVGRCLCMIFAKRDFAAVFVCIIESDWMVSICIAGVCLGYGLI